MDFLITGANGQVGRELQDKLELKNYSFTALGRDKLDITDINSVDSVLNECRPKLVINTAAYTAVDKAEDDRDTCFNINSNAVRNLAKISKKIDAKLVHISTDYVFDGSLNRPLCENDVPNPLNVYGASKLEGEKALKEELDKNYLIIRTSSVHGQYGANFVKTMIRLLNEKNELKVVDDQVMSPTHAGFLAETIIELVEKGADAEIYNVSNSGAISWYEFTLKIREYLANNNPKLNEVKINPCISSEFPRPASRPKFSAFNLEKTEEFLGHKLQSWQDGLKSHLTDLNYMVE